MKFERFLVIVIIYVILGVAQQVESTSGGIKLPLTRKPTNVLANNVVKKPLTALTLDQNVPLKGSVEQYGEYFVSVGLGTPPQFFEFQVDTGSTDLLVYGKTCKGCPLDGGMFDISRSSTAAPVPCNSQKFVCDTNCFMPGHLCPFDDAYGDGSDVSGFVVVDKMTIGGMSATVSLGVIQNSTDNFEPHGVDGIFGLASPLTSSWGSESPLITNLLQNNEYKSFGMCLTSEGGSLSLGINEHKNPNVTFVDTVKYKGQLMYYPVNITDIEVDGSSLQLAPSALNGRFGALVDSGTTLMLFPPRVVKGFANSFKSLCSKHSLPGICSVTAGKSLFDGYCYSMTDSQRKFFPPLTFTLGGNPNGNKVPLTISHKEYLIPQGDSGRVVWCLGITASPQGDQVTILGDTFMRGFYVVFDAETESVGFGPQSSCP